MHYLKNRWSELLVILYVGTSLYFNFQYNVNSIKTKDGGDVVADLGSEEGG